MDEPDDANLDLEGEYVGLNLEPSHVWGDEKEPETFRRSHAGKIVVWDAEFAEVSVGIFEALSIDIESAITEGMHPFNVFDVEEATIGYYDLYTGLNGIKDSVMKVACGDDYLWCANLLIIQRLIIEPKYRGHGLGLAAMRTLILKLRGGAGLVAIKPFPLQFEGGYEPESEEFVAQDYGSFPSNQRTATTKLHRLYAKLGFKRVPRTPYMVLDVQRKLPTISELRGGARPPRKRHQAPQQDSAS